MVLKQVLEPFIGYSLARKVFFLSLCFGAIQCYGEIRALDLIQAKVSYTYNFAKNIRWPDEHKKENFKIGVFELDDPLLFTELKKLNSVKIRDLAISVNKVRKINSLIDYDLIYVGSQDETLLTEIQTLVTPYAVLMVTEEVTNKRIVMINLHLTDTEQLQFEVNKANLINSRLNPLPELILLGGTEIDIAELYRKGQSSLLDIQRELLGQKQQYEDLLERNQIQREKNQLLAKEKLTLISDIQETLSVNNQLNSELEKLNITIRQSRERAKEQQIIIEDHREEILNQQRLVDEKKAIIDEQLEKINKQLSIIESQNKAIDDSEAYQHRLIDQVRRRNEELDLQKIELAKRQLDLERISSTINEKEHELSKLNTTMKKQKIQLSQQQSSINELDMLVNEQQRSLYFLFALIGVVTLLCGVIIYAYRTKRRDNTILSEKSRQLTLARDHLESEKIKAEQANQTKSDFLSLMSHELRTPLQSIIGYTDILIEELHMENDTQYIDQVVRVSQNGQRLLELINNTLDLAKIEAGKMLVELTHSNIEALVEEGVNSVKPLMEKNNNKLIIHIDDSRFTPVIDYNKVLHILVNLLSNANKYTRDGKITITIHNQKNAFLLSVRDTGDGLNPTQLRTIFDPFYQVANKKRVKFKGTGLGLSICQHFCEIQGGNIRVDSSEGSGAEFVVSIPLPVVVCNKTFGVGSGQAELE